MDRRTAEEETRIAAKRSREIRHDAAGARPKRISGNPSEAVSATYTKSHTIARRSQIRTRRLDFRDADQRRSSQGALEFDESGRLFADCDNVAAARSRPVQKLFRALESARRAHSSRRFGAQLGEHSVEHHAGHFVSVVNIVQYKGENVGVTLDN